MSIHPTALIDPAATVAPDVRIGPYCVIGPAVAIEAGTQIGAHCVIQGPTHIGPNNRIYSHAALGGDPQDKKYAGEPTGLRIGAGNTIREFVTFNRGTVSGGGVTTVGDDNWIMAYVHIAHDCHVGNHTILANNATLAGHVEIGDWAILGGYTLLHQFCRIGAHAFTSMGSKINCDVPPYVVVAGEFSVPKTINTEGLKRRGFSSAEITHIRRAFKTLYKSDLSLDAARSAIAELAQVEPKLAVLSDFIAHSERGLLR